jgi:hypothetical protein
MFPFYARGGFDIASRWFTRHCGMFYDGNRIGVALEFVSRATRTFLLLSPGISPIFSTVYAPLDFQMVSWFVPAFHHGQYSKATPCMSHTIEPACRHGRDRSSSCFSMPARNVNFRLPACCAIGFVDRRVCHGKCSWEEPQCSRFWLASKLKLQLGAIAVQDTLDAPYAALTAICELLWRSTESVFRSLKSDNLSEFMRPLLRNISDVAQQESYINRG